MDTRSLSGKVAFVTGAGRPRGIGRAAALELARAGADVVVTDIARPRPRVAGLPAVAEDDQGLHSAVAEIESMGRRAVPMSLDVTDEGEVIAVVETAVTELGGIDILFNNAGTPLGAKPFLDLDNAAWQLSWDVHVMGMVHMCRAVSR